MNEPMRVRVPVTLVTLIACCVWSVGAGAQTQATWETNALVNEAHNLTPPDLERVRQQASVGDARAQSLLGLVYEMGAAGVTADPVQALGWFNRAASQGVPWAETWAGDFYYTGSPGVPRDLYKAVELYKSAAEHGSPTPRSWSTHVLLR
jgi:TPR repeat protein